MSRFDLVIMIETKLFFASSLNLADMSTMMSRFFFILEVKDYGHRRRDILLSTCRSVCGYAGIPLNGAPCNWRMFNLMDFKVGTLINIDM